mgnify:CR=1 FL=1
MLLQTLRHGKKQDSRGDAGTLPGFVDHIKEVGCLNFVRGIIRLANFTVRRTTAAPDGHSAPHIVRSRRRRCSFTQPILIHPALHKANEKTEDSKGSSCATMREHFQRTRRSEREGRQNETKGNSSHIKHSSQLITATGGNSNKTLLRRVVAT